MKTSFFFSRAVAIAFGLLALFSVSTVRAQAVFAVTVNTTPLIGHPAGPFYLDFQLNDGAGTGDGDNTAIVSSFNFSGGAPLGAVSSFGNATGNLASSVTLRDSTPFNEFFQAFTPGTSLQFLVTLNNHVSVPVPDSFSFAVLDAVLFNLPTLAPGSDAFVTIDINGGTPLVHSYAGSGVIAPEAGGSPIALAAPAVAAVPEPSTYGLLAAGLLAGVIALRRRK
jgi:hypothetical protein